MKYQVGDMLKFIPNASWKTGDLKTCNLYCIVCDTEVTKEVFLGGKDEITVWWINSADGKSFMQRIDVTCGVYGTFQKVA
jgi:hypothetical protein